MGISVAIVVSNNRTPLILDKGFVLHHRVGDFARFRDEPHSETVKPIKVKGLGE